MSILKKHWILLVSKLPNHYTIQFYMKSGVCTGWWKSHKLKSYLKNSNMGLSQIFPRELKFQYWPQHFYKAPNLNYFSIGNPYSINIFGIRHNLKQFRRYNCPKLENHNFLGFCCNVLSYNKLTKLMYMYNNSIWICLI